MSNDPDQPRKDREFEGRTYLYIRTNPADDGSEPLPAGLRQWISPDIMIVRPDGSIGTEATADAANQVRVVVTNGGGIGANDAYVDVFFADPSTTFTPATSTLIGGGYLTIPGYSIRDISFPWTPTSADAGHRCLCARVALFVPPDTYADPSIFDVRGDRHVAQRNIHVVALAEDQQQLQFSFAIVNPFREPARMQVTAREVRDDDERKILAESIGCGLAQFGAAPLRQIRLIAGQDTVRVPLRDNPMELLNTSFRMHRSGVVEPQPLGDARSRLEIEMQAGEIHQGILEIQRNPQTRRGDIHAINIVQTDRDGQPVGGLTVVVQH